MIHIIEHSIKDTIVIIPFLFIAFLIMEYIEHKFNKKTKIIIEKSGKLGPLFGALIGMFPQCGFSVLATNFYAANILSIGTLVAVYLSTSDEMLPIMISKGLSAEEIITILLLKVCIAIMTGFVVDAIYQKTKISKTDIKQICKEEHCECHHDGILKSSIKHTLNITLFIFLTTFVITLLIETIGENNLSKLLLKDSFFGPFVASLFGLIPNCASSVIITELFLSNAISFGSMIAGLLTGSGIAILLLFKVNKNKKENFTILSIIYFVGVFAGIVIDLLGI